MVYNHLTAWSARTLHGSLGVNIQTLPKQTLINCIYTYEFKKQKQRWGQWEEGIAGTIIKDTWTKSGGGGREVGSAGVGGGRGEKAYNCN